MFLNKPFIGKCPNITSNFTGGDTEELFQQSLYSQASDWYYRDVEITYSFNEYGHRCKNIKDIDLNNYVLFTGCSHTEGVGLELEKTYPHIISSELGCDYYNLGISGSGIDIMIHNLVTWFNMVKEPPKYLFVQWPSNNRFIRFLENERIMGVIPSNCDDETLKFMAIGENINYFNDKQHLYEYTLSQFNLQKFRISFEQNTDIDYDANIIRNDLARDLAHAGNVSHQRLASSILKLI